MMRLTLLQPPTASYTTLNTKHMDKTRFAIYDYITDQIVGPLGILCNNAVEIISLKLRDDHEEDIDVIELPNYANHYIKYYDYYVARHPEADPEEATRYASRMITRERYTDADTIFRKLCPNDEPGQYYVQGTGDPDGLSVSFTTNNYDILFFAFPFPSDDRAFYHAFTKSNN